MGASASQITSITIIYSTINSGADQRKHQNSSSLAFVRGIQRWPVNSPHKWPVTQKMFSFDDVISEKCEITLKNIWNLRGLLYRPSVPPILNFCVLADYLKPKGHCWWTFNSSNEYNVTNWTLFMGDKNKGICGNKSPIDLGDNDRAARVFFIQHPREQGEWWSQNQSVWRNYSPCSRGCWTNNTRADRSLFHL